jgi:hypothetical protein
VESEDNLTQKSRLFFSKAVNTWDADFYVKMDDNVGLNLGEMTIFYLVSCTVDEIDLFFKSLFDDSHVSPPCIICCKNLW